MIALNEIVKNKEYFEKQYKLKGLFYSFDKILKMENQLRELQLKTEKMRADCNKLCGDASNLKEQRENKDKTLIESINKLNKDINKNNNIIARYKNNLNKLLSKLHNVPDKDNNEIILLETQNKGSTIIGFENFLTTIAGTKYSNSTLNKEIKSLKNEILENLPICHRCKNGYLILCKIDDCDRVLDDLIDYMKANSLQLVNIACKDLEKFSAQTISAKINKNDSLNINVIREYYTRAFKIKYHDNFTDMSKFVNQINIQIKKNKSNL